MPRKDKVIHISNLPSTFRGNVIRNGRFIQNGIPPLGGAYDKVAKSTGLIRLGNEFLYNGINNLVSKDNREKLIILLVDLLIMLKILIKNLFLVMMNLDQHFHLILFKLLEVMEEIFLKNNMLLVVKYQM